jgi:hypothetical protein
MIEPSHKGFPLVLTRSAMKELFDLGLDLVKMAEVLDDGYDCYRSRRKKGTLERCVDRSGKTIKVVAVLSYNHSLRTEVWAITHVCVFTKRR